MPTLAMIVKREREIRNYVKKPFYKIVANIEATDGAKFTAEAADKYDTETAAKAVIDEIKLNTAKAIKVEVLQKQTAAPLYITLHICLLIYQSVRISQLICLQSSFRACTKTD